EAYKGKLIVYSMGNFIFDQLFNDEVSRSAAISVLIKSDDADKDQLEKWFSLAEECFSYQDDCLERAQAEGLEKLPLTFSYDVVTTTMVGRVAHPASEEQTRLIINRLKWDLTAEGLEYPHTIEALDES